MNNIEREDVEFVCKSLGCRPIASLDHFTPENLVSADLVEEVGVGTSRMVKITGNISDCIFIKVLSYFLCLKALNKNVLDILYGDIYLFSKLVHCIEKL